MLAISRRFRVFFVFIPFFISGCENSSSGSYARLLPPNLNSDSIAVVSYDGTVRVQGTVRPDSTVEFFATADCSGPVYRSISASQLNAGVSLSITAGKLVLSSLTVDPNGNKSTCVGNAVSATAIGSTRLGGSSDVPFVNSAGIQGVLSPTNYPTPRTAPSAWSDGQGNFWMYAGNGSSYGDLADVWEYRADLKQWVWMSGSTAELAPGSLGTLGVADPLNYPISRAAPVFWQAAGGNVYVFGGYSSAGHGYLADLWNYNTNTNLWTWVSGPQSAFYSGVYGTLGTPSVSNAPPSRLDSNSWVDNDGNLWMQGGSGAGNNLADFWRFKPSTLEWTWVSGPASVAQNAVFDRAGLESSTATPGSASLGCNWVDKAGMFWMMGGVGIGTAGSGSGLTNDVWKFNPKTLKWTWVAGSQVLNPSSVYGTMGVASPDVHPGGRRTQGCWLDSLGRAWVYGGEGYDSVGTHGFLGDLWFFDPNTALWTWVGGPQIANGFGTYPITGTFGISSLPGPREDVTTVTMPNGEAWLFGGRGNTTSGSGAPLGDLWSIPIP